MLEPLGVVSGGGQLALDSSTGGQRGDQSPAARAAGSRPKTDPESLLGTKKQPACKNQHGKEMKNAHPGPPRPRSSLRGSFWKRHDYCCHC